MSTDKLEQVQTPALVIRLDRVRDNVERMIQLLGGQVERWRPHVKTTKIPEVLDLLFERGVRRFKCATTREAEVLLSRATEPVELLLAMALRGANLRRLGELAREFPLHTLSVLVEDPDHVREVCEVQPDTGVYVDLNPGFDRTGIPRDARDRVHQCAVAAGPQLRGLHDYEGHVRAANTGARVEACQRIYRGLVEIAEDLSARGVELRELVTSGTPTFLHAIDFAPFAAYDHQVGPGTIVYWDDKSEAFDLSGFQPAATVLSRVISAPATDRVTCDAGSKAVDAAAGDPCVRVAGHPGLRAGTPSEEHMPLIRADGPLPQPGDLLELIPAHVCPTVNLADEAVLIDPGTELRFVRVAARGHAL